MHNQGGSKHFNFNGCFSAYVFQYLCLKSLRLLNSRQFTQATATDTGPAQSGLFIWFADPYLWDQNPE